MNKGFSREELDRLDESVHAKIEEGIPYEDWTHAEQMWSAWYVTGQRCPSVGLGSGMNLKPKMEKPFEGLKDVDESDAVRDMAREFDELDREIEEEGE